MSDHLLGGRYRLQRRLGHGATATVWQARDTRLDRDAAVKILDAKSRADPAALKRLRSEARLVARLAHDNIVRLYDVADDAAYLVMELVEGHSLTEMLALQPRMPVEQAVSISVQICDALAAAHAAGVVHRDIKPSNILVGSSGVVKVCDFGIALLDRGAGEATLTGADEIVGTCQYMAPEQAAGEPVDGRADLYAVGCVLYAMLAGAPPFAADHPMDVLDLHLKEPPVPLRVHRDEVPPALDRLVDQMLAKHAADRPATAWSVRERLRRIGSGEPAAAPTVLLPAMADPTDGRHRTAVLTVPRFRRRRRSALNRVTVLGAGAVATAVLATALVSALVSSGDRPDASAQPPPGPSASQRLPGLAPPARPSSDPVEVNSPTPPVTPATSAPVRRPPTDRLAGLVILLQREVDTGQLEPKTAKGLLRDLERVVRSRNAGQTVEAAARFAGFREQVSRLRADGGLVGVALPDLNEVAASLRTE